MQHSLRKICDRKMIAACQLVDKFMTADQPKEPLVKWLKVLCRRVAYTVTAACGMSLRMSFRCHMDMALFAIMNALNPLCCRQCIQLLLTASMSLGGVVPAHAAAATALQVQPPGSQILVDDSSDTELVISNVDDDESTVESGTDTGTGTGNRQSLKKPAS